MLDIAGEKRRDEGWGEGGGGGGGEDCPRTTVFPLVARSSRGFIQCSFTSTETIRTVRGSGAKDDHLDFHTQLPSSSGREKDEQKRLERIIPELEYICPPPPMSSSLP